MTAASCTASAMVGWIDLLVVPGAGRPPHGGWAPAAGGRAAGAAGAPSELAGDAGTGLLAFSAGTGQLRPCMLAFVDHRGHQRTDEEHGGGVALPGATVAL
ncbi:hypothetical protein G6F46_015447 [Rhizopus delemar]|nr:hypothetical protein G6F46_015447 [Rhizopus delemar]